MGLMNCQDCGKLCIATPLQRCPECQWELERAEAKVVEFLEAYPLSLLDEVQRGTGVKRQIILRMIREGRIIEGTMSYPCENCGSFITKGRICIKCADDVLDFIKPRVDTLQAAPEKRAGKMYIRHQTDRDRR